MGLRQFSAQVSSAQLSLWRLRLGSEAHEAAVGATEDHLGDPEADD